LAQQLLVSWETFRPIWFLPPFRCRVRIPCGTDRWTDRRTDGRTDKTGNAAY